MKKILLPLLLMICAVGFAYPQKKKKIKRQQEQVTKIEFETFTRRGKTTVTLTRDSAIVLNRTEGKFLLQTPGNWSGMLATLKPVKLSSIPSWEPPSKKHQYDGASHCTIVVTTKSNVYKTKTFDGGNPVKELKPLYDAIDTMRNSIDEKGQVYNP